MTLLLSSPGARRSAGRRALDAPFPYFGGKAQVASVVWDALGDVAHYIEPFCGSCAVLLLRPRSHQGRIETVNDADGHIANVWRALQADPDAVAKVCDWPVNHADLIARKKRLNERAAGLLRSLCDDDKFFDVELAGYYIWAASCWIGHGLIRPNQIPHLAGAQGVHRVGQIPHLGHGGTGVHRVAQRPHLGHGGTGVHRVAQRPHLGHGKGVQDSYKTTLYEWFRDLSERLRYVRVVCGDWRRVCGGNWQAKQGMCGMFFDPPYGRKAGRTEVIYAVEDLDVADDVQAWCLDRGSDPAYRIILAGYYEEHESLIGHGWTCHRWSAAGGYARLGTGNGMVNRHREALFLSPHCVRQATLFEAK